MTTFHVRNYRRVKKADIELAPLDKSGITLVCGRNEAGKTSLAEAMRAALTGEALVAAEDIEGKRSKSRALELLHDETDRGSVILEDGEDLAQMTWPKCEYTTRGHPPQATPYAAALRSMSLVFLPLGERARFLGGIIGAEPEWDDLLGHFKKNKLSIEIARVVWTRIAELGWDGALAAAKTKGAELKGGFREITDEAWGAKKGEAWRPEDWDERFDGQEMDNFKLAVTGAQSIVDEIIGEQAVSQERREQLEAEAGRLEEYELRLEEVDASILTNREELEILEKQAAQIIATNHLGELPCPSCGTVLQIINKPGTWTGRDKQEFDLQEVPEDMDTKTKEKMQLQIAEADGRSSTLRANKTTLGHERQDVVNSIGKAETAKTTLDEIRGTAADPEKLAKARETLAKAQANLTMFETVHRALGCHRNIMTNHLLQEALGDNGIRRTVLNERLGNFYSFLKKCTETAKLPEIKIDDEMYISMGERPYRDLSGSAQLRLRAALQVAVAKMSKSSMIVLDIDDSTDRLHVQELFVMLTALEMPALVLMHSDAPGMAPNLQSPGAKKLGIVGKTYWIEDGEVKPI